MASSKPGAIHYTFSEPDLSLIRQRRGDANRLGVAAQLCLLRFPGQGLLPDAVVPVHLLQWIGRQLRLDATCWPQYAEREETRREHLLELRAYLGMEPFGLAHYRQAVHATTDLALQTDKGSGLNLVTAAIVLWNTVYLERAANALRGHGHAVDAALLQYLSPLGWEHINLTGDYLWRSSAKIGAGKFRPLRPLQPA